MKTEKKVNYMNLSNKNKFIILRNEHNLTQEQVAEMLNISKSTYCRIENGTLNIGVDALKKLLQIYNITFEDFYNIRSFYKICRMPLMRMEKNQIVGLLT